MPNSNPEPILPTFLFVPFLIFPVKLSHIEIQENTAIAEKNLSFTKKKVW
jgi:hypothetical protein